MKYNTMFYKIIVFFSLSCIVVCSKSETKDNHITTPQLYVEEILILMKEHSLTRKKINWDELVLETTKMAKNATTIKDVYTSINFALKTLNTNHTFISSPEGDVLAYYNNLNCSESILDVSADLNNIGYIKVNAFSSTIPSEALLYATQLQNEIAAQDNNELKGWIVDLRYNHGGNMWPMIAGIGPLIGEGVYGYFINKNTLDKEWGYSKGSSYLDQYPMISVAKPYVLKNTKPKIAVLTSRKTASSGEATLISFSSRENIRFFGTQTCGLSTANKAFLLSDGSKLYLTTSFMADRNKQIYDNNDSIDQVLEQPFVISAAVKWLND